VRRLGELHAMRAERRVARSRRQPGEVRFGVQDGRVSGKMVVEAAGVSKSFGDRAIVRDLTLRIERGDRIGIVGPNGAGKTTLINLLTGNLAPDAGSVRLGTNLDFAAIDQGRDSLDGEKTVADILTDGRGDTVIVNGAARHVIGYMRDFLFRPEQARAPVKALSGGERGRLMLARALGRPSNLLVLDEPTNDLDLETLDLLQEMLAEYPGTLLLVSHDRDFLDRVVTSVVASEGDGRWTEYAGGYSDMVAQRGSGIGAKVVAKPASTPSRSSAPVTPRPASRQRLSFKDQHALKELPGRIDELTREIARLETRLSDAGFYARDTAGFAEASKALDAARLALADTEEEWLRLETLRESIEG
jgi:ATP-binding cassette subfamily F protein uup